MEFKLSVDPFDLIKLFDDFEELTESRNFSN